MNSTRLLQHIGEARMAVHYGQPEVTVSAGATYVRVWREGPGIEGITVDFLCNRALAAAEQHSAD